MTTLEILATLPAIIIAGPMSGFLGIICFFACRSFVLETIKTPSNFIAYLILMSIFGTALVACFIFTIQTWPVWPGTLFVWWYFLKDVFSSRTDRDDKSTSLRLKQDYDGEHSGE